MEEGVRDVGSTSSLGGDFIEIVLFFFRGGWRDFSGSYRLCF